MPNRISKLLTVGIGAVAFLSSTASASEIPVIANAISTDTEVRTERESLFPQADRSLVFSHFTWGADVGSSIDLTGHDFSTFDIDALLGYKNDFIRIAGLGVGVHKSFGANNMFVPVYGVFRSSFRKKPSPLFLNLKVGYSFNTIEDSPTYGDISASIGLGMNLAMSRKFQSHIILSWSFKHFTKRHRDLVNLDTQNINLANVIFGVNF